MMGRSSMGRQLTGNRVKKAVPRKPVAAMAKGGKAKSRVNEAGNYTKPTMRKSLFKRIKAANVQGTAAGKWSARKAQLLAKRYKAAGGGYT